MVERLAAGDPACHAAAAAPAHAAGGAADPSWQRRRAAAALLALVIVLLGARRVAAAECGGGRTCRCGDTVVADYTLPDDVGPCPENGLRVRRAIVLDGNGHLVRGRGAKGSVGVQVDGAGSGARIRDLAITGFERGLRLAKAERVRVEGVAAHDNGKDGVGYGIDLAGGASRNVLERVQVFRNADEGIHVGSAAHENHILDAEVHDNGRENVYFLRNHGNVLARSKLWGAATAVYVKHAARTVLEQNRIDDGAIHLRGDSRDTVLDGNVLAAGALVLQRYRDKDAKIGLRAPTATLVRGGRITSPDACVRVEGATRTTLDDVALDCPRPFVLRGATVTTVGARRAELRCSGEGAVERARRVDVRFVDSAGRAVSGVEVRAEGGGAAIGVANERGIFSGLVVESVLACGEKRSKEPALLLQRDGRTRKLALDELRGDVLW